MMSTRHIFVLLFAQVLTPGFALLCKEGEEVVPCLEKCVPIETEILQVVAPNDASAKIEANKSEAKLPCGSCNPICIRRCNGPNEYKVEVRCIWAPCYPLCLCKPGYTRDSTGKCVKTKQSICGENMRYEPCKSTCLSLADEISSATAVAKKVLPNPCLAVCAPGTGHCVCNDGYILDAASGKCVPTQVKACKKKEMYIPCVNTCVAKTLSATEKCLTVCAPGTGICACASGYIRDQNGDCVKIPIIVPGDQCGPGDIYIPCASGCLMNTLSGKATDESLIKLPPVEICPDVCVELCIKT